jgi:hypothetical protein
LSSKLESDEQTSELLLELNKGHIRNYPLAGIGLSKQLNNKLSNSFKRDVEKELLIDGVITDSIYFENDELIINIL